MMAQFSFPNQEAVLRNASDPLRQASLAAMAATNRAQNLELVRRGIRGREDEWLDFAERNRIGSIAAHALLDLGHEATHDRAKELHERERGRMDVLLDELDTLAERLDREGIQLVALKNAGIARGIFPCAGCCPMGDIDVLVDRSRFREAHALLLEQGFHLRTRSQVEAADLEEGFKHGGTEYHKKIGDHEVWFELQWRAVAGRLIQPDREPATSTLLERSVPIDGTKVRLLSPADNLLQVALHTAKHSYVRAPGLRLHTDVDRLVQFAPPEWSEFLGLVEGLRVKTAVYWSLVLAGILLGTPIPDEVLAPLAPSQARQRVFCAWLRRADLFEPDEVKFSRLEMIGFHSVLFDDPVDLVASAVGVRREEVRWAGLPGLIRPGISRSWDLLRRYQI